MNHVDCVITRDVYPQKMQSCSKNIRVISLLVLKISVVYEKKKYIVGDIAGHARIRGGGGGPGVRTPLEFWQKCGYRIRERGWFDIAKHLC